MKEKYGVDAIAVRCDITDVKSIEEACKMVTDHFGHVEVIVNDAGGEKGTGTKALDYKDEDWLFTLNLDLTSVFRFSKVFGKYRQENINAGKQNYGRIINIASLDEPEIPDERYIEPSWKFWKLSRSI